MSKSVWLFNFPFTQNAAGILFCIFFKCCCFYCFAVLLLPTPLSATLSFHLEQKYLDTWILHDCLYWWHLLFYIHFSTKCVFVIPWVPYMTTHQRSWCWKTTWRSIPKRGSCCWTAMALQKGMLNLQMMDQNLMIPAPIFMMEWCPIWLSLHQVRVCVILLFLSSSTIHVLLSLFFFIIIMWLFFP